MKQQEQSPYPVGTINAPHKNQNFYCDVIFESVFSSFQLIIQIKLCDIFYTNTLWYSFVHDPTLNSCKESLSLVRLLKLNSDYKLILY